MKLIKGGKWELLQYQISIVPSWFVKMKKVAEKTKCKQTI